MSRRTLITILASLILLTLIAVGLFLVFRGDEPTPTAEPSAPITAPFPFGNLIDRLTGRESEEEGERSFDIGGIVGGPTQVIISPQAGFTFTNTGVLRYIERDTGRIYEQDAGGKTTRLTNTTLSRVRRADWTPGGTSLLLQHQEPNSTEIKTIRASLEVNETEEGLPGSDTTPFILDGQTLPSTIADYALSPGGDQFAALHVTPNAARITVQDFDSNTASELLNTPHSSWQIDWSLGGDITAIPKPAEDIISPGFLINASNASLERFTEGEALTVLLSPDGTTGITTTYTKDGSLRTQLEDYINRETTRLPFVTYPAEKCVYISNTQAYCGASQDRSLLNYPEDWYQGSILYSDDLWSINTVTGNARRVYETAPDTLNLDIINAKKHPTDDLLYFENKADNSIWSFPL